MGAAKLTANCLAVLDEVEAEREPVLMTENGRPTAQVVPFPFAGEDPTFDSYRGKIVIPGDIESPIYSDTELDEFFERSPPSSMILIDTHTLIGLLKLRNISRLLRSQPSPLNDVRAALLSRTRVFGRWRCWSRSAASGYRDRYPPFRRPWRKTSLFCQLAAIAEQSILFRKPFPKDPSDRMITATRSFMGFV